MQDATLPWNMDLLASATGDIALASGTTLGQQRVLRRLLTNPGDYIWHPTYGAGLGQLVGAPSDRLSVQAAIRSQLFKENAVARIPEPVIDVQGAADGSVYVHLRYVDFTSGATQILAFSIGP